MPASHVDLVSHWRTKAPLERVWAALADIEGWPGWWFCVREVRTLRQAGADGMGGTYRITFATRMPRFGPLEIEIADSLRPESLRCRLRGRLRGEGIWLLRSADGFTDLTCVWRIETGTGWMRWLKPVWVPLLRWNHDAVMRTGGTGLARHLAA